MADKILAFSLFLTGGIGRSRRYWAGSQDISSDDKPRRTGWPELFGSRSCHHRTARTSGHVAKATDRQRQPTFGQGKTGESRGKGHFLLLFSIGFPQLADTYIVHSGTHSRVQITELKAGQFRLDQEFRVKIKTIQKEHEAKVDVLQQRIKTYQKEVATLNKANNKQKSATQHQQQQQQQSSSATANANSTPVIKSRGSGSDSDSPRTSWNRWVGR